MSLISFENSTTDNDGIVIEQGKEKRKHKSSASHGYHISIHGKNTVSSTNNNILLKENKVFVSHT
jgi:hypothetical protein